MIKNKKSIIIYLAIIISIILLTVFVTNTGRIVQEQKKIKIGIITPTTGQLSFLGENIVRSAELAVDDLGYNDSVQLIVEDAGNVGGNIESISAYRKLVDIDNVDIIIDGMSSDGTMAVSSLLSQDKMVMITPVTGGENIDNASDYLLRNGPSDIYAGTKPAEDFERLGYKKIALFTDNAEYTLDISRHFKQSYNGEIVLDAIVSPDSTDFHTTIAKMQDYDAILILTSTGQSGAYIIKQLCEQGNTKPIYGNFILYNQDAIKMVGSCMDNVKVYYPQISDNPAADKFLEEYESRYKTKPPIIFHATGTYDAIRMSVEAAMNSGHDGAKIRQYLLDNIKNWNGLNGNVTFDSRGHVIGGFVLMSIVNGSLQ